MSAMYAGLRLAVKCPVVPGISKLQVTRIAPVMGATVHGSDIIAQLQDERGMYHSVLCPTDGAVVAFDARPGQTVAPGDSLMTLDAC